MTAQNQNFNDKWASMTPEQRESSVKKVEAHTSTIRDIIGKADTKASILGPTHGTLVIGAGTLAGELPNLTQLQQTLFCLSALFFVMGVVAAVSGVIFPRKTKEMVSSSVIDQMMVTEDEMTEMKKDFLSKCEEHKTLRNHILPLKFKWIKISISLLGAGSFVMLAIFGWMVFG